MNNHQRILLLIFVSVLCLLGGTSCRTVQGVGSDIEHVRHKIHNAVN